MSQYDDSPLQRDEGTKRDIEGAERYWRVLETLITHTQKKMKYSNICLIYIFIHTFFIT